MFAQRDKHYPSRSGQTSLAAAVINITKPVTKNYLGPVYAHCGVGKGEGISLYIVRGQENVTQRRIRI